MTLWLIPADGEGKPNRPVQADSSGVPDSSLLKGKRAVIVEDEGMTVWQLRRILTLAGIQVVGAAANGREGVEITLREKPDLVLMDMTMPEMNGLEAARRILEEFSTCIVMVTAYDQFREEAAALGAGGYITKPVSSETLLPALESCMQQWQRRHSSEPFA